jgi:hypothetical protein
MNLTGEQLRDLAEGTAVRVLSDCLGKYKPGDIIFRQKDGDDCEESCRFKNDKGTLNFMRPEEVELIIGEQPSAVAACGTIARPVLEERKVGKIAIELFDHGFPNAIMAVGEVMTWAAEHKGYKPHDWKNLPNAEISFDAAASRHRIKRHIQTGKGLTPEFRTDEESDLLHLAHEAFNVLAQLELTITGGIR